jgi:integrase/recombinase XerD
VPSGKQRKTSKMFEHDPSAFICYINHVGLYADFHSLRHLFITNLERAGISTKMAQVLARHSDIRLTMNVYTHVELHDQAAAIEALPGPPSNCYAT